MGFLNWLVGSKPSPEMIKRDELIKSVKNIEGGTFSRELQGAYIRDLRIGYTNFQGARDYNSKNSVVADYSYKLPYYSNDPFTGKDMDKYLEFKDYIKKKYSSDKYLGEEVSTFKIKAEAINDAYRMGILDDIKQDTCLHKRYLCGYDMFAIEDYVKDHNPSCQQYVFQDSTADIVALPLAMYLLKKKGYDFDIETFLWEEDRIKPMMYASLHINLYKWYMAHEKEIDFDKLIFSQDAVDYFMEHGLNNIEELQYRIFLDFKRSQDKDDQDVQRYEKFDEYLYEKYNKPTVKDVKEIYSYTKNLSDKQTLLYDLCLNKYYNENKMYKFCSVQKSLQQKDRISLYHLIMYRMYYMDNIDYVKQLSNVKGEYKKDINYENYGVSDFATWLRFPAGFENPITGMLLPIYSDHADNNIRISETSMYRHRAFSIWIDKNSIPEGADLHSYMEDFAKEFKPTFHMDHSNQRFQRFDFEYMKGGLKQMIKSGQIFDFGDQYLVMAFLPPVNRKNDNKKHMLLKDEKHSDYVSEEFVGFKHWWHYKMNTQPRLYVCDEDYFEKHRVLEKNKDKFLVIPKDKMDLLRAEFLDDFSDEYMYKYKRPTSVEEEKDLYFTKFNTEMLYKKFYMGGRCMNEKYDKDDGYINIYAEAVDAWEQEKKRKESSDSGEKLN